MNFYKHHIGDYDADTSHLSWDQDLAYRRLISLYCRREQPIPADVKEACRLVRAQSKTQRDAVESVLREFFRLDDTGWHNKRCDQEIEAAAAKGDANRENGKLGGRPKKNRTETKSVSVQDVHRKPTNNPDGFCAETQPNLSQTPDSTNQIPQANKNKGSAPAALSACRPEWSSPEQWQAFLTVRARKKAAATPYALGLVVKQAERFAHDAGCSPAELLDASVRSGWSDVYAPKSNGANGQHPTLVDFNGRRMTKHGAATASAGQEWLDQQREEQRTYENEH